MQTKFKFSIYLVLTLLFTVTFVQSAKTQQTFPMSDYGQKFFYFVAIQPPLGDGLVHDKVFYDNTTILTNGQYHLEFHGDGNLVLYNNSTAIWASGKTNAGASDNRVVFQTNGWVRSYNAWNYNYWNAYLFGGSNVIWVLQSDGNFVGYDHYTINGFFPNQSVTIDGYPFAATGTAGGKKSNHQKYLN